MDDTGVGGGLTSREPPGTSRHPLGQSIPTLSDPIGSLSVTWRQMGCDIRRAYPAEISNFGGFGMGRL